MVTIKGKSILLCLIVVSLIFAVPAVQSFSFTDLSDMVGYVLFNSFLVVTGMAGGVPMEVCSGVGGMCIDGGICPDGYEVYYYDCIEAIEPDMGDPVPVSGLPDPTAKVISDITGKVASTVCCIPIESECGDGTCDDDETCEVGSSNPCPQDCQGEEADCGVNSYCDYGECIPVPAPVLCGNDLIQGTEVCDGIDFGGLTCADYEQFDGGDLACSSDCLTIDTSGCTPPIDVVPYCGDETCNGDETCANCVTDCGTCTVDPGTGEVYVYSCSAINGICTDSCGETFMHYSLHDKYDEDCEEEYGNGFMCCLPSYTVSATTGEILDEEDWDEETEGDPDSEGEYTGSVKNVEDYMIDKQQAAKSAQSYLFEGGLTGVLSSLSYAMGGVWVIFVLTVVVVMITYYLHKKSVGKKKEEKI